MTKEDISVRLAEIRTVMEDPTTAHSLEDELYHDFARYVAGQAGEELAAMAHLVLSSEDLDFPRYFE